MRLWILGAPDPEMEQIERLLADAGEQVAYALDESGQRVHPGSAYRAVELSAPVAAGSTVYAVECGGPAVPADAVVIDHHRPGDPGYGRPPADFLSASSIGQAIAALARLGRGLPGNCESNCGLSDTDVGMFGVVYDGRRRWAVGQACHHHSVYYQPLPEEYVFAAAADHCLAAAYRGECPGVDPDALMRWRAETRAAFQRRSVDGILADVERARERLRAALRVEIGDCGVADLRGESIPELPEAAAREGVAYLATVTERDGRTKVVLGGRTDARTVRAFIEHWGPQEGLVGIYGDPARGFAGAYLL